MYHLIYECYYTDTEIIESLSWEEAIAKARTLATFAKIIGWTRHNAMTSDVAHMDYFVSGWNEGHITVQKIK